MKGNYLVTCPPDRVPTRGNTFQIRRREVVGAWTGSHKGQYIPNKEKRGGGGHGRAATRAPSPRPHPPLPLLYYTRPWRADSPYSRGEGGRDAVGGPLWSPVRCLHPSPYLQCIGPCGRPSDVQSTLISLFAMYCPQGVPGKFSQLASSLNLQVGKDSLFAHR